jgi:hypothetical protein
MSFPTRKARTKAREGAFRIVELDLQGTPKRKLCTRHTEWPLNNMNWPRAPIALNRNAMKRGRIPRATHTQRSAVEYADHAYELAKKAHAESGEIESL